MELKRVDVQPPSPSVSVINITPPQADAPAAPAVVQVITSHPNSLWCLRIIGGAFETATIVSGVLAINRLKTEEVIAIDSPEVRTARIASAALCMGTAMLEIAYSYYRSKTEHVSVKQLNRTRLTILDRERSLCCVSPPKIWYFLQLSKAIGTLLWAIDLPKKSDSLTSYYFAGMVSAVFARFLCDMKWAPLEHGPAFRSTNRADEQRIVIGHTPIRPGMKSVMIKSERIS